jgi:hypothetical protein
MYLSLTEMVAIMIALGLSILLILITIYANHSLLRENRILRGRIRRQSDQCIKYHSPRPF